MVYYAAIKNEAYHFMQNLKRNYANELVYKTEIDSQRIELMVARGEGCGEVIIKEFGMDRYTLLYLKWITKKGLLCPLLYREFCSTLGGSLDGREIWGRIDTYIYMAESLCCPPETVNWLYSNTNKEFKKRKK